MILRVLSSLAIAAGFCGTPALAAPGAKPALEQTQGKQTTAPPSERSNGDLNVARQRDDARHREWDRKMKALAGSVCTGC